MTKAISTPQPVKLFVGMLANEISLMEQIAGQLEGIFGPIDLKGPVWPWEHTAYYQKEMGPGLKRQFVFFEHLVSPGIIADTKLKTIELENKFLNINAGRRINLDPGYLDSARLVLASTKDFSHRIYLGNGIYGEITLIYSGKDYQVLPYTFPDYRTGEYMDIFKKAREIYKSRIRETS